MTNHLVIKMILDAWYSKIKETDSQLEKISNEQLQREIAPGKNRGIYLLGHLASVHDRILPLMDFGPQLYPQLNDGFVTKPDNAKSELATADELRLYWKNVNASLATHFSMLSDEEWMQKHTSVSAEDFLKEPHRNKLNIVISRTSHLAYHQGQLVLLKK